jgi:hypothetical protein
MEPVLIVAEPETERWVKFAMRAAVVTAIEVQSHEQVLCRPGCTRETRPFSRRRRQFVEIDLLREGRDAFGPRNTLTAQEDTRYRVCVRRSSARSSNLHLPAALPTAWHRMPLRESDSDVVLALQPVVDLCLKTVVTPP